MCAASECLLAAASRGREVLAEMLTAAGATVEQVVVYESRDVADAERRSRRSPRRRQNRLDNRHQFRNRPQPREACSATHSRKTRLAAISPLTAEVLTELGYPPAIVADTYTTATGILPQAILAADSCSGKLLTRAKALLRAPLNPIAANLRRNV